MCVIKVREFVDCAALGKNGIVIKNKIKELLENGEKKIELDFSSIDLFTMPFFRPIVNYLVFEYKKEKVNEVIELINISELEKEAFNLLYEEAKEDYSSGLTPEILDEIFLETLHEMC